MTSLITIAWQSFVGVCGLALVLTYLHHASRTGADWLARTPGLDVVVALLTWVPWVLGAAIEGWAGVGAVLIGQCGALLAWTAIHELSNPNARRGPRIVKSVNRIVGAPRNHAALWVTLGTVPVFWSIRFGEILLYPLVRRLIGFPALTQREWISVSRHKFSGLIGHDLVWCLYCDWMTGVYALGAEMLRNIESFWCPIRFYDDKKCNNCAMDFPDATHHWVASDGTMQQVSELINVNYSGSNRSWLGHESRGARPTYEKPTNKAIVPEASACEITRPSEFEKDGMSLRN